MAYTKTCKTLRQQRVDVLALWEGLEEFFQSGLYLIASVRLQETLVPHSLCLHSPLMLTPGRQILRLTV